MIGVAEGLVFGSLLVLYLSLGACRAVIDKYLKSPQSPSALLLPCRNSDQIVVVFVKHHH